MKSKKKIFGLIYGRCLYFCKAEALLELAETLGISHLSNSEASAMSYAVSGSNTRAATTLNFFYALNFFIFIFSVPFEVLSPNFLNFLFLSMF